MCESVSAARMTLVTNLRGEEAIVPNQNGETPVLDTLGAMTAASLERCDVKPDTLLLVRLAALAAVDARPVSYLAHIGPAVESGITLDDVENVLVAIAPIVGTARTASAAINIAEALDFAIAVVEEDSAEAQSSG